VAAPRRWLVAALAGYVLFLAVSVAASFDPRASLRDFSELFTLTTLLFGLALVRGERRARWLVDGLGALGALVALWGLAQYLGGYGEIDRRIRGPFSHWMTFSGFLLLCDLLLVAALLFRGRRLREEQGWGAVAWRAAALVAINAALLGSLTRSAWVGLAVAVAIAAVLRSPRTLVAFPLGAVAFILLAPVPLLQRVGSTADLSDPSNYDRLCMAEAGLRMIAERPLTGLGPELVKQRYPIYRPATAPRYGVPHLHNAFLQVAAERGLPALAAYLLLMAAPLVAAWRLYRREGGRRGPRADLLIGVFTALVAFNLASLFEHNWGDTEVQRLVLFLMAVPFGLAAGEPAVEPPSEAAGAPVY
jgi:O-antigen ligase